MSAIAGILSATLDDLRLIAPMGDQMAYRGPMGDGWAWLNAEGAMHAQYDALPSAQPVPAYAALGHRRHGNAPNQPLSDASGRYWISMDGQGDPGSILAAFSVTGSACFSTLEGGFAIAIFDVQERTLTLARDRFGIKPLYTWLYRGHFAFASEIKALFVLPEVRPKMERNVLGDFILGNPAAHGKRFFANVLEFPPAHAATISVDMPVLKPEPFWQPPAIAKLPEQEAAHRFRELFTAAVTHASNEQAGICLTGGIASTAMAIAMHQARLKEQPLYSFSAVFDTPELDERTWLTLANSSAHSITNYLTPAIDDCMLELDTLLWHYDEPFADPAAYAQWCVMRAAQVSNIDYLLDGFGAEVWHPAPAKKSGGLLHRAGPEAVVLKRLMRQAIPPSGSAPVAASEQLRLADRNGMAFGVENRLPLLDNALAEFCLSLPPMLRGKPLWQQAFADIVPEPILNRPERARPHVPLNAWMRETILPALLRDIKTSRLPLVPMVDGGRLRELVTRQSDRPDVALEPLLFRLFIANRWMLRFNIAPSA